MFCFVVVVFFLNHLLTKFSQHFEIHHIFPSQSLGSSKSLLSVFCLHVTKCYSVLENRVVSSFPHS